MSSPTPDEFPPTAEDVLNRLARIEKYAMETRAQNVELQDKLDKLVISYNQMGENVAWLVANTQGVFQMFNNPEMMSQLMGKFMGGGDK